MGLENRLVEVQAVEVELEVPVFFGQVQRATQGGLHRDVQLTRNINNGRHLFPVHVNAVAELAGVQLPDLGSVAQHRQVAPLGFCQQGRGEEGILPPGNGQNVKPTAVCLLKGGAEPGREALVVILQGSSIQIGGN